MTLNAGAAMVPVHMISDVTVSPAHRRRGLLRTMMVEDLAQTTAPVAALTVSEASIYGRFGFGPASFRRRIEVDTTATFAMRDFVDPGRVELVEPADLWDIASDVFARFHASSRGSVERPHFYRAWQTGRYDPATGSTDDKLRAAVHLDADERPDGYVLFKHAEGEGDKPATVTAELLTLDTSAHLGLWRFLADIDLSSRVAVRNATPTTRSTGRSSTATSSGSGASTTTSGSACSTSRPPSRPGRGTPTTRSSWASPTRSATRRAAGASRPRTAGRRSSAPTTTPTSR